MLNTFSPNRIGGLRFIAAQLLTGAEEELSGSYIKWLNIGTEVDLANAEAEYDKWYDWLREYHGAQKCTESDNIVRSFVLASEQAAFEDGARFGAQMMLDLMGVIPQVAMQKGRVSEFR